MSTRKPSKRSRADITVPAVLETKEIHVKRSRRGRPSVIRCFDATCKQCNEALWTRFSTSSFQTNSNVGSEALYTCHYCHLKENKQFCTKTSKYKRFDTVPISGDNSISSFVEPSRDDASSTPISRSLDADLGPYAFLLSHPGSVYDSGHNESTPSVRIQFAPEVQCSGGDVSGYNRYDRDENRRGESPLPFNNEEVTDAGGRLFEEWFAHYHRQSSLQVQGRSVGPIAEPLQYPRVSSAAELHETILEEQRPSRTAPDVLESKQLQVERNPRGRPSVVRRYDATCKQCQGELWSRFPISSFRGSSKMSDDVLFTCDHCHVKDRKRYCTKTSKYKEVETVSPNRIDDRPTTPQMNIDPLAEIIVPYSCIVENDDSSQASPTNPILHEGSFTSTEGVQPSHDNLAPQHTDEFYDEVPCDNADPNLFKSGALLENLVFIGYNGCDPFGIAPSHA